MYTPLQECAEPVYRVGVVVVKRFTRLKLFSTFAPEVVIESQISATLQQVADGTIVLDFGGVPVYARL